MSMDEPDPNPNPDPDFDLFWPVRFGSEPDWALVPDQIRNRL